ncbi:MAG: helix-turn-helix transcriptional regulator, partial [Clostridia bacterium]|nr:helix-turn-helix transcriptional regulator [Clostridia bacterium]
SLAALCHITPEYFRKIFKSIYGTSPLSYINNLKITRAKELLSSRMYSVCEAATEAGYRDMSHFCREFKKATGQSPGEYMKRVSQ